MCPSKIMREKVVVTPGGGILPEIWVRVCGALLETLILFQTKMTDFPYPISDLPRKTSPCQELLCFV